MKSLSFKIKRLLLPSVNRTSNCKYDTKTYFLHFILVYYNYKYKVYEYINYVSIVYRVIEI